MAMTDKDLLEVRESFPRFASRLHPSSDAEEDERAFVTGLMLGSLKRLLDELERSRRLEAWLDRFEAETRALPVQHEDESKGCSSFNWRMSFVRAARAALSG